MYSLFFDFIATVFVRSRLHSIRWIRNAFYAEGKRQEKGEEEKTVKP